MRLAVGVILVLLATTGASAGDSVSGMTGLSSNLGAPQAGIKIVGMGVLPASSSVNIGSAWSTATFHGTRSGGDAAPLTVILGKMSDGTVRAAFSGLTNWHDEFTVTGVERCGPRYRSEEHTSELQSLMRNSYAVF